MLSLLSLVIFGLLIRNIFWVKDMIVIYPYAPLPIRLSLTYLSIWWGNWFRKMIDNYTDHRVSILLGNSFVLTFFANRWFWLVEGIQRIGSNNWSNRWFYTLIFDFLGEYCEKSKRCHSIKPRYAQIICIRSSIEQNKLTFSSNWRLFHVFGTYSMLNGNVRIYQVNELLVFFVANINPSIILEVNCTISLAEIVSFTALISIESTGDCVIAINTRHVALRNDAWRAEALHVRREYAKTRYDIPLFKLHEMDPTKVMMNVIIDLVIHWLSFRFFIYVS